MSGRAGLHLFRARAVWAYNRLYQAEKIAEDIAMTLLTYGIRGYMQEVCYGLTWQGDIAVGRGAVSTPPARLRRRGGKRT